MALKSKRLSGLSSTMAIFLMCLTHSDAFRVWGLSVQRLLRGHAVVLQWPHAVLPSPTVQCSQPVPVSSECGDAQRSISVSVRPARPIQGRPPADLPAPLRVVVDGIL